MELFETSRADVEVVHDYFIGSVKAGSTGVKVRLIGLVE
jgi:hypothetical protein